MSGTQKALFLIGIICPPILPFVIIQAAREVRIVRVPTPTGNEAFNARLEAERKASGLPPEGVWP